MELQPTTESNLIEIKCPSCGHLWKTKYIEHKRYYQCSICRKHIPAKIAEVDPQCVLIKS